MADGFKQCRGPVQLGGKTATVNSSWTLHKAGECSMIQGQHPLRLGRSGSHQIYSSLRTGISLQEGLEDTAPEHGADHGIPGAGTPPGSHSPRGRGRGRDGFLLHLLCAPAALPASVLKRSQSERVPEGTRGCGLSPTGLLCMQRQLWSCQHWDRTGAAPVVGW